MNVLYPCTIQIIYDCTGAISWGPEHRKVSHIVQSAMYKSLHIKKLILMFWLIVHNHSDSDSDSDSHRIIRYIYVLDQYWVFVMSVCTRSSDSDSDYISSRVTETMGDIMWHELTLYFLCTCCTICFHKLLCFWYYRLLWIYVIIHCGKISFYEIYEFMIYVFLKKKACNIFCNDKPSLLGMILFTELTAHTSSLLFAD